VELWTYYEEERLRLLNELVEIASHEDTNTSVYVTDEDGFPYLYVYRDDKKIFESKCYSQYMAERNLREIYASYLTPLKVVSGGAAANEEETEIPDDDDEDADTPPFDDLAAMTDEEWGTYCDEREDVIHDAVLSLIDILTEDETSSLELSSEDDDSFNTVVDKVVEYLAIKCGFRIRRPMEVVDDDSGELVRSDYPYEDYDFGEGDLP
jgi:hypothetical protein